MLCSSRKKVLFHLFRNRTSLLKINSKASIPRGVLPKMAPTGRLHPKGVPFLISRLQVYERVGISLVEVYERLGKTVISACKKSPKRANRDAFHGCEKSWELKRYGFVIYSYLKDSAFTAVKTMQSFKVGMWKGYHLPIERYRWFSQWRHQIVMSK